MRVLLTAAAATLLIVIAAGCDGTTEPDGTDAGFVADAATQEEKDGGATGGSDAGVEADAGTEADAGVETDAGLPPQPVPSTINAAITKELQPLEENAPVVIEVGTLSHHPVLLINPRVEQTDGPGQWFVSTPVENFEERRCPDTRNGARCRQYFRVEVYGDCRLNADKFTWTFDVDCVEGGDCSRIDPDFRTFSFTTTHNTNDFCSWTPVNLAPWRPSFAFYKQFLPANPGDPVDVQFFTSVLLPYELEAGTATAPAGFGVKSFTLLDEECPGTGVPDACRQWWSLKLDPVTACSLKGKYQLVWDVKCTGANCDPRVTTYTANFEMRHTNVCP